MASMQELVSLVSEKTGISEDVAQQAVNIVLGYLKDRLPQPIASKLDSVAQGQSIGDMSDLAGQLGGLFGGKK
ncbi:MAG TPA: hypothetical protein PK801_08180 [Aggregatilineales bacterium]|nr:DUF2267 domain-containing protein [Chloroflexota bacterium]HOA23475.1 hypothetical protein [Aggregatilineales bacterium]HPV06261.1 hypothetical protein [Aggregatilineales bacterium]HQA68287.1 hypothetical protein [Aggregatilineales bacterium]HQE18145.1 hypothetical protein [Aggregatilineales bacterium]